MPTPSKGYSRRNFLAQAYGAGALYAISQAFPLRALGAALADDPRIAKTPIADAGFASIRKIGEGAYATISDPSKGFSTLCNGGFVVGRESSLLIEGFVSANGAAFQYNAFRSVSQLPPTGALDTHYHYDHSMGNSFYGANNIPLWGFSTVGKRILENYAPLQSTDRPSLLAPMEKRLRDAKSDAAKEHLKSDIRAFGNIIDVAKNTPLTTPNRPLEAARLPLRVDLGGYPIVIEHFPGHSGTDLIVRVPEQNIVFTGDLLFDHAYPATFDEQATISGWRETLRTFASYGKDTIFVPGHGQICGQESIALLRSVFDDISEQAEKLYKAGVPAADAYDLYVVPEKFKSLYLFSWGFCIGPAVSKLYAEWEAKKS